MSNDTTAICPGATSNSFPSFQEERSSLNDGDARESIDTIPEKDKKNLAAHKTGQLN